MANIARPITLSLLSSSISKCISSPDGPFRVAFGLRPRRPSDSRLDRSFASKTDRKLTSFAYDVPDFERAMSSLTTYPVILPIPYCTLSFLLVFLYPVDKWYLKWLFGHCLFGQSSLGIQVHAEPVSKMNVIF